MSGTVVQTGEKEACTATEDLRKGSIETVIAKLKVAQFLAQGGLKEAPGQAVEDLDAAGKVQEAIDVLQAALRNSP